MKSALPIMTKTKITDLNFFDVEINILAEQLTLMEYNLLKNIKTSGKLFIFNIFYKNCY